MADLLRLCTAGSVDDGKSTLIGRLLYDSRTVYDDHVRSVEQASRNRTPLPIDFSLFTDGLCAEREQGITIDVAYRYFRTPRRTFVLADTPGHEQYTRNMATGASTADLAILLVDARHGLRPQTERHARIARLLGISAFVVAVNKMDLIGFDRASFEAIAREFARLVPDAACCAVPISALHGDNVTARSSRMPWFDGPSLLEHLETVRIGRRTGARRFRFPVQLVVRPDQDFRGYAGQVVSGSVRTGDGVIAWPSGLRTTVQRIVTWDGDLDVAEAPMSVTLVLGDALDVGRGALLADGAMPVAARLDAQMVWMDERPLQPGRPYLLKQGAQLTTGEADRCLALNEIGSVVVTTARPLAFDSYSDNQATGSFILIDPVTNFTAGAGMIAAAVGRRDVRSIERSAAERLTLAARSARTDADAVEAVRRALEEMLT